MISVQSGLVPQCWKDEADFAATLLGESETFRTKYLFDSILLVGLQIAPNGYRQWSSKFQKSDRDTPEEA